VGVFVACGLFLPFLIIVSGYEWLSCQQQQESHQRNAALHKHPTGSLRFSEILGMKGTRYAQTTFILIHYFLRYSLLLEGNKTVPST